MRAKPGRRPKSARLVLEPPRRAGGVWRWVIHDRDVDGRRSPVATGCHDVDRGAAESFRPDAEQVFAAYLAQKPRTFQGRPDQVSVFDVLALYAQHKAEQGYQSDQVALSLVKLNEFFAEKTLDDVTLIACNQYVEWRCGHGDARSGSNRRLKPATARNDLTVLDAAQHFAFKNRRLTHIVPISKPPTSEPRLRFLTRSEVARLLLAALGWDQSGKRNRKRINRRLARFILIAVYTGTRRDRILRLQWVENLEGGWIDLDRGTLHRRSRTEVETKKRAPSVPLGDRLRAHMRRWRKLTTRYVIERNGRPIEGLFNAWERVARDAGLNHDGQDAADRVVPHSLRHSCVSWLLAEGETMFNVGKFVGMLPTMVERVYGHVTDDQQRSTANAIGSRRRVVRHAN